MSNDKKETVAEYQDKMIQQSVNIALTSILEFNSIDYAEITYESFLRTGLPLMHGMLKGEIPLGSWIRYIGGVDMPTKVTRGGEIILEIPRSIASIPTNVFEEAEAPTFSQYVGELDRNRRDNPDMWEAAVSQRLRNSFATTDPNVHLFITLNKLFVEHGYSEIKLDDFVSAEVESSDSDVDTTTVSEKTEVLGEEVDFNQGDCF